MDEIVTSELTAASMTAPACLRCTDGTPGPLVMWGKLAERSHLGPHCARHTEMHVGTGAMAQLGSWAIYDLRAKQPAGEHCRQCRDERAYGATPEPAVVIVWGRTFDREALGPKCLTHALTWTSEEQRESGEGVLVLPGAAQALARAGDVTLLGR